VGISEQGAEGSIGWAEGAVAYPGILFGGGLTNSVEDKDRENWDLGAVAH